MKYRKFDTEKQAVAGVIEALLLVALIAVVISIIQLQYIPQIMEQKEAEHMDDVSNQFSYLKSVIDTQALTGSIATDAPLSHVPMTSMITLGSRELPYFITAPSFGEVRADQDENSTIEIHSFSQGTIGDKIDSLPSFPLTSIVYDAYNSYFVDQTYVFEGGGIIVAQPDGESVMRADPSISIKDLIGNPLMIEMKFYLPNIIEVPGKNISSSSGNCFIRTNYSSYQTYTDIPIDFGSCIIIKSKYLNAWDESLNGFFREEIRNNHVNITIWPYPTQGIDVVKVSVLDSSIIDLKLTVVNIIAQVGPGWVT
jgi:hypothetical protein